jgi:hypothetical protein
MIGLLPEERWGELTDIFAKEFDAEIPNIGKASIIADVAEDGTIRSFLVAEHLMRVGLIHSENGKTRGLVNWVLANMPRRVSVITIASEPRFEKLFERFGMRRVEGTVFRRDF